MHEIKLNVTLEAVFLDTERHQKIKNGMQISITPFIAVIEKLIHGNLQRTAIGSARARMSKLTAMGTGHAGDCRTKQGGVGLRLF